jgi:CheY-like chemotaxis protein
MSSKAPGQVLEQDVYALTEKGNAELRGAGTSLSSAELEILVLIDGRASVAQLIRLARGQSREAVLDTLGKLVQADLVAPLSKVQSDAIDPGDFFSVTVPLEIAKGSESEAGAEIAQGVTSLQQRGYYVRIARRAAAERKLAEGQKLAALVVEDEPHLAKLLSTYLKLEGFVPRLAGNREEIIAAFRQPVAPDLVILDVTLPDADGFDILGRMRQHPALRAVPVVMLTAKATRESVLKGLQGGADGYVTKPFEIDALMKAVKTVLGLIDAPAPAPAKPDKP